MLQMSSGTLRRRFHHGDVDVGRYDRCRSSRFDTLNEPFLGIRDYDPDKHSKGRLLAEEFLDDELRKECFHWSLIFSDVLVQWSHWLDNIILQSGSLFERIIPFILGAENEEFSTFPHVTLSPLQEERLKHLKWRLSVPFDGSSSEHQDALRELWRLSYPDRQIPSLKSEVWKDMGWQGSDPSTDFRGAGFISLENLIFFAKTHPEAYENLLHKRDGNRSHLEYPFAVAGVNLSFMLVQMLDLQSGHPSTRAGQRFLEFLAEDEMAFDNLFCVAFELLDVQWLAKRATYMEFNDVLKLTRVQLERELALEDVSSVRDLPSYNLLRK